ncbi:hypothetical protein RRG08_040305 [Elysia crispata]|uniref:Uncharacterized protein n=1 Tax=Elysia crispata TaxID=231223 RepID=A0AAE1D9F0_9GAST|nr:hypothetical protein RRG08_040305 [Elysia crispata]
MKAEVFCRHLLFQLFWTLSFLCLQPPVSGSAEHNLSSYDCHADYYNIPYCRDHPDGYGCVCGPGFYWNTYKCISMAIDSRFEFKATGPIRYTLLLDKTFPMLSAFTIAFWINVSNASHSGTILSYKYGKNTNILRMMSGPYLKFSINRDEEETDFSVEPFQWHHMALTWSNSAPYNEHNWHLYVNGSRIRSGRLARGYTIPMGGEFVLGQTWGQRNVTFDQKYPLDADLVHLNIWDYPMRPEEVRYVNSSCTFMYCGNAVQWVEFRSGTRGAMRMRWPSGVFPKDELCVSKDESSESCDTFCSEYKGAQCNEEIKENILWSRQKADQNISVECPTFKEKDDNSTVLHYAQRSCQANSSNGVWQEPYIDDCVSDELLQLKAEFKHLKSGAINEIDVLKLTDRLLNHTEQFVYLNPIDIATVIDLMELLVKTQGIAPRTVTWPVGGKIYATANEVYPTFQQTKTFCELLVNIANNLLSPKNQAGWNATRPSGAEGDSLMKVMHDFANVTSRSLDYHIKDSLVTIREAKVEVIRENVEFRIELQWKYNVSSLEFPYSTMMDKDGRPARNAGFVKLSKEAILSTNTSGLSVFFGISTFRYKSLSLMLPTHEISLRSKNARVNTPILALYFHMQPLSEDTHVEISNLTSPIIVQLPILNTFNISNPYCVRLRHGHGRKKFRWTRAACRLTHYTGRSGICACSRPGVYAITTDMFDDNWDKGDKRPHLMNFASYFGCTMSAMMCLMVCGVHTYLRTSTSTAALHRNLSVSVALSQLVFMFGINQYESPTVCQVFAILLHYFFLATYSWLMNEAFNLYIVITYSAHNPSDITDAAGSMIKYYILGWVLPAIGVGIFVGTIDNYRADDMCWIAPDHMWLFIGPAIGIMSITILVLIFTAKEHNENSYTKSDKSNKVINIHMKALWTQVILVTVVWAFAFISVKMLDTILKYLYAMFTSLQGAFFVVFYMLLHDEVRAWIKSRQKRRALQLQGFEFQDNHSLDSFASNSLIDRDLVDSQSAGTGGTGSITGSGRVGGGGAKSGDSGSGSGRGIPPGTGSLANKDARPPRLRELAKRRNRAQIEASSDEGSDCEMISSV